MLQATCSSVLLALLLFGTATVADAYQQKEASETMEASAKSSMRREVPVATSAVDQTEDSEENDSKEAEMMAAGAEILKKVEKDPEYQSKKKEMVLANSVVQQTADSTEEVLKQLKEQAAESTQKLSQLGAAMKDVEEGSAARELEKLTKQLKDVEEKHHHKQDKVENTASFEQTEDNTVPDEDAVFKHHDADASSFLEQNEVHELLRDASATDFDWRSFDKDQDGRWNKEEFVLAGRSAASLAQGDDLPEDEAGELGEDGQKDSKDDGGDDGGDDPNSNDESKEDADLDSQKEPEKDESEPDTPKGEPADVSGQADEDAQEPDDSGSAGMSEQGSVNAKTKEDHVKESSENSSEDHPESDATRPGGSQDKKFFKQADTDGNGFLDKHETQDLLNRMADRAPPMSQVYPKFDANHDGRLSFEEFVAAGARKDQPMRHQRRVKPSHELSSFVNKASISQGSENSGTTSSYDEYDLNKNGLLEASEMKHVMKDVGMKENTWRHFDENHDGKITRAEFDAAAQQVEEAMDSDEDTDEEVDENAVSDVPDKEAQAALEKLGRMSGTEQALQEGDSASGSSLPAGFKDDDAKFQDARDDKDDKALDAKKMS